ncbi:MAG: TOBE domain-containing protein [Thiotrichaceae bacterium]
MKAVITQGAVEELAIRQGSEMYAFFKASTVTLAIEE